MKTTLSLIPFVALAIVFSVIFYGCQENSSDNLVVPDGQVIEINDQSGPDRGLSLNELKRVNPRMIGAWGGDYMFEDWFIQSVRQPKRLDMFFLNLNFVYALIGSYPDSMESLDELGYLPFGVIDPISGESVTYNKWPKAQDDFANMMIDASENGWYFTHQYVMFPDATWHQGYYAVELPDVFQEELAQSRKDKYQSPLAMRGAMFAYDLYFILWDYENRYREMPLDSEQLLDGLWEVRYDWAEDVKGYNFIQPGGFIFGYDSDLGIVYAEWRDEAGNPYNRAWRWDPWPTGWDHVPIPGEDRGEQGAPVSGTDIGFMPDTILWTCSLYD